MFDWVDRLEATSLNRRVEEAVVANVVNNKKPSDNGVLSPKIQHLQNDLDELDAMMTSGPNEPCIRPLQATAKKLRDSLSKVSEKLEPDTSLWNAFKDEANKTPSGCHDQVYPEDDIRAFARGIVQGTANCPTCGILTQDARSRGIRALLLAVAREEEQAGYTVVTRNGVKTAIIGVVGIEEMGDVSQANQTFCSPSNGAASGNRRLNRTISTESNRPAPNAACPAGTFKLSIVDPLSTAFEVARAAKLAHPDIRSVIVMAQMSHSKAEILGARLATSLRKSNAAWRTRCTKDETAAATACPDTAAVDLSAPSVGVVLSKADTLQATPSVTYAFDDDDVTPPILTPIPAYDLLASGGAGAPPAPGALAIWEPVRKALHNYASISNIGTSRNKPAVPVNAPANNPTSPPSSLEKLCPNASAETAAGLLMKLLCAAPYRSDVLQYQYSPGDPDEAVTRIVLQALTRGRLSTTRSRASTTGAPLSSEPDGVLPAQEDVAFLMSRDVFLGWLPKDYRGYEFCDFLPPISDLPGSEQKSRCYLRTALDRILWKGDFAEALMLSGSDITSILKTSQDKSPPTEALSEPAVTQEWLTTFGITTSTPTNLTRVYRSSRAFSLPVSTTCVSTAATDKPQSSVTCVNGEPLKDDRAYWILTSDALAESKGDYAQLGTASTHARHTTPFYLSALAESGLWKEYHSAAPNTPTLIGNSLTDWKRISRTKRSSTSTSRSSSSGSTSARLSGGTATSRTRSKVSKTREPPHHPFRSWTARHSSGRLCRLASSISVPRPMLNTTAPCRGTSAASLSTRSSH